MRNLYKMTLNFGRMGTLEGVFVADSAEVEALRDREVYFGEVLGKHSDCTWTFDDLDETVKVMTDDRPFIERFESLGLASGYNPLDYIDGEGE